MKRSSEPVRLVTTGTPAAVVVPCARSRRAHLAMAAAVSVGLVAGAFLFRPRPMPQQPLAAPLTGHTAGQPILWDGLPIVRQPYIRAPRNGSAPR